MTKKITARQATPGTVLRLTSTTATERVIGRYAVVRWESEGDGTANLVTRNPRGQLQNSGIYGPDHEFELWPC